jgi:hypothetical protein
MLHTALRTGIAPYPQPLAWFVLSGRRPEKEFYEVRSLACNTAA